MTVKWFRRLALPVLLGVVLLIASMVVLPRPAAAQDTGPGVDEVVFSVLPQAQAVQAISGGDLDVYIFTLESPDDKDAARANADVNTLEAPAGLNDMLFNPVPHAEGVEGINPFQFIEVREAMNWAFDRQFIVDEIYGGFAIPMTGAFFAQTPDWVREAGYYAALEQEYSYDPQKAMDQISARLSTVPGVTFDSATEKWLYQGNAIEVNIVQRVEDLRFDIGAYVATELNNLGFTSVLDPSPGAEAFANVYAGDPTAGVWHVYTEGWISGGIIQFDDGTFNFFYNGDFGSAWWDFYDVRPSLAVPCEQLQNSQYTTLEERQDLFRRCQSEGMRQGIRVFLLASLDMSLAHTSVQDLTFDVGSAFNNWFGMKTASIAGQTGGTLRVAQPIHTITGWNPISGFTWIYEEYQRKHFSDPGIALDPRLGTGTPFRTQFEVETAGPVGTLSVPEDAAVWNTTSNSWDPVGPGVEAVSQVDLTFTFGDWHHGQPMTMDDIMVSLANHFRYFSGDLSVNSPSYRTDFGPRFYSGIFKGVMFDAANNSATIWADTWNFDESIIAANADWWATIPWEVEALIARSVLDNDTAVHEDDASQRGVPMTDLVKGDSLPVLKADLDALRAANHIPPGADISAAEAMARWDALDNWYNNATTTSHFFVSNGPFYIDQVTTDPEGTVLKAFRDGYPFDLPVRFQDFTTIVKAGVTIGDPPQVIQTFPATFDFTTSFQGQPYDRIATANFLVSDPGTGEVLFTGDATRTGAGQFEARLTATQTTALVEGSYEFTVVVGTEESVIPTFASTSFSVQSLQAAILGQVNQQFQDLRADLEADTQAANDAAAAANAAASTATLLAYVALGIAAVATVVAIVAVVALMRARRQPPT